MLHLIKMGTFLRCTFLLLQSLTSFPPFTHGVVLPARSQPSHTYTSTVPNNPSTNAALPSYPHSQTFYHSSVLSQTPQSISTPPTTTSGSSSKFLAFSSTLDSPRILQWNTERLCARMLNFIIIFYSFLLILSVSRNPTSTLLHLAEFSMPVVKQ